MYITQITHDPIKAIVKLRDNGYQKKLQSSKNICEVKIKYINSQSLENLNNAKLKCYTFSKLLQIIKTSRKRRALLCICFCN